MPSFGPAFDPGTFDITSTTMTDDETTELIDAPNNIVKLLISLLSSANDVESMLFALLTERNIDTASLNQDITDSDAPLRVIGRIVNQPWLGEDSETYRRYCRARISVNRSSGTTTDLIIVANLIINTTGATYIVTNEGVATVRLRVAGIALTDALADILFIFEQQAISAGVRIIVEWSEVPLIDELILDSVVSTQTLDTGIMASELG